MKTKFITIFGGVFLILTYFLVTSCNDEFTDFEKLGAVDSSLVNETTALSLTVAMYDRLQLSYGRDWNSTFLVKLLPGDDANAAGGSSSDQQPLQDIDDFDLDSENSAISSVWETLYTVISQANFIEETLIDTDVDNKELYMAEAKFFRAWCYLELTTMFGEVPLRVSTVNSQSEFPLEKSSQDVIYALIEEDLVEAISGLPDKTELDHEFRVTQGAAQGLMGKALVHQEKYAEAVPYFEAVISNAAHDLEANVEDVWTQAGDFGVESLFEVAFSSEFGYNWSGGRDIAWGGRNESNLHAQLMGPRASDQGGPGFVVDGLDVINGWGFNLPTAKLITAFEDMADVDRKAATIATEAEIIAAGGEVIDGDNIWDYEGAIRLKYATRTEDSDPDNTVELNYTTNFKIFRYAEVLLLAAEAYNQSGNDAQALIELNKIRVRAGLEELTGVAGDDLFNAIVDEKFLELAHEGQRFWDLVRWDMAATELSGTNFASGKNELFPIPEGEINLNASLTAADQNSGY